MGIKLDRKALTALLDDSARQLPPSVVSRLSGARQLAVQRQAQHIPLTVRLLQLAPAWSAPLQGHPVGWGMALLAALLLAAFLQWQHLPVHDHSALDLAILTDELPVQMYAD